MGMVRNGCGHLVHETLQSVNLKNKFMNSANCMHANCEEVIFGNTNILLCIFDF